MLNKLLSAFLVLLLTGLAATAQTPTADQLNALKNMPKDQQDALLQSVLGGKSDGTGTKTDSKLSMPETVQPKTDPSNELLNKFKKGKTLDDRTLRQPNEDPELRADDTVLIDLTPIDRYRDMYSVNPNNPNGVNSNGSDNGANGVGVNGINGVPAFNGVPGINGINGINDVNGVSGNAAGDSSVYGARNNRNIRGNANEDYGRVKSDVKESTRQKTDEEKDRIEEKRQLILKNNPYHLNRFGVLELPGLPSIPLAGLTADEAANRLSADPDLRDFTVKVTLLRLQAFDEQALKPFGYDLFEGVPSTFAPVSDIQVPIDYVVGPGDTMRVQLYGNEPATYELTVGRDGRINFPKLGPIMVSGMSFDRARAIIEDRVKQQLIGSRVSVTMGDLRSIRVFVVGDAEKPGSYTVSGLSTMTNALFVSGGVKKIGSLRNIELKRNGRLVSVLDLYDLLLHGDTSADRQLMPGDVIFIPPIGVTATVYGAVRRPAVYELKKEKTADQLIDHSGGLSPDADGKLAQLERIEPSRLREMRNIDLDAAGRNTEIMNGDKLRIPAIRPTLENSVELSGDVFRPGAFQYKSGLRLTDILGSFDELRPEADRHYIVIRREVPPENRVEVISADLERALSARGSEADPLLRARDRIIVLDLTANRTRVVWPILDDLFRQASATNPPQFVNIYGEVKVPGSYPLEPSMHVSDLIRAGGMLERGAYTGEAELTRSEVIDGKERQTVLININLSAISHNEPGADLQLKPYDALLIKKTPRWDSLGTIELVGEIRHPGTYPIHQGETLS